MATQQSATVNITNDTDGTAWILLYHSNSSNGGESGSWTATPGQTVGSITVTFETGSGTHLIEDYWSVLIHVQDGSTPGFYVSGGTDLDPYWKECQLQHEDAGQTLTLTVSSTTFGVNLISGSCSGEMTKIAPYTPVTNVFVLMLENHSFDNVFAFSGIPNINAATTSNYNEYNGNPYYVQSSAPLSMPSDPGHEFPDVVEQLAGVGATYAPGATYPPINNSGFAANYATSTTEGPTAPAEDIVDIMSCFNTPSQMPVMYDLASNFTVCDAWYSSLPGPTWPNRFFLHGASSSGLDTSPTNQQMAHWEIPDEGFQYPNGSIYMRLDDAGIPYRFYNDSTGLPLEQSLYSDNPDAGDPAGAVPQVSTLSGVTLLDFNSLKDFAADLQGPYPYPYTFIEPHYGDVIGGTYAGGSSQHPMDDVYGGENLLWHVYSAIRNSPYWNSSVLIVTYDEHGGFYDSVAPPPAIPPGDNPNYGYSVYGFNFSNYGVRVPAVVVSPFAGAQSVDFTPYDHTSVLALLEALWGLKPLTQRDANANVLGLQWSSQPRTDCPTALAMPAPLLKASKASLTPEQRAEINAQPLPEHGNAIGALMGAAKVDIELSGRTPAEVAAVKTKVQSIKTRGEARAYIRDVMQRAGTERQARRNARRTPR